MEIGLEILQTILLAVIAVSNIFVLKDFYLDN